MLRIYEHERDLLWISVVVWMIYDEADTRTESSIKDSYWYNAFFTPMFDEQGCIGNYDENS